MRRTGKRIPVIQLRFQSATVTVLNRSGKQLDVLQNFEEKILFLKNMLSFIFESISLRYKIILSTTITGNILEKETQETFLKKYML